VDKRGKTGDNVNILNRARSLYHGGILDEIKCASFPTDIYKTNLYVEHRVSVVFLAYVYGMYLSASMRAYVVRTCDPVNLFSLCLVFSEQYSSVVLPPRLVEFWVTDPNAEVM
jgi:hypothetical protein